MPKSKIALSMKITRMAVWKIWQKYKKYGNHGLVDHKSGRLFEPLNSKFYDHVISKWKEYKCGARKLHFILKHEGFGVSCRKIEQVLVKEGFQKPFPKRQKPRRYKRYEWPIPNYMWHTDWHVIKSEKMKGENILVYIDDCTRKVMSHITGDQTTNNSLFALYKAIDENLVTPFILNSDRGTQFMANKTDKKGEATHEFQEVLNHLGIQFVPSKRRHPQTNGKNEKFFHILDTEFDERFETLDQFIDYYNNKRPSEALDYMTPNEAYKKRL
jgi:biotin operon repressor